MTQTAREKAIELFRRVFNDAERLDEQLAADLVDAIVATVQAQVVDAIRVGIAEVAKAQAEILDAVRAAAGAEPLPVSPAEAGRYDHNPPWNDVGPANT